MVGSKGGLEDGEGEWSAVGWTRGWRGGVVGSSGGTRGWRGGVVGSRGGLEDGEGEWSAVRVD